MTEAPLSKLPSLRSEVTSSVDRRPSLAYAARGLALAYGQLALTLAFVLARPEGPGYLALGVVAVGLAQYHLYFPLHDASHLSLLATPRANRVLGRLTAGLLGSTFGTFTAIHMDHHRHYGTERDTGSIDYWVRFQSLLEVAVFFLLPVLGVVDRLRLNVGRPLRRLLGLPPLPPRRASDVFRPPPVPAVDLVWLGGAQLALFLLLSRGGTRPLEYVLFWIVPALSVFMVLARLRMYLEHGPLDYAVSDYLGPRPRRIARTHGGRGALALLSGFNFRFHAEHHLVPSLPSCRLPEVHRRFMRERLDPDDWSPSYLASLARLIRLPSSGRAAPHAHEPGR